MAFGVPTNPFGKDGYFSRVFSQFGWRYVAMVFIIYGINQGVSITWSYFARDFYFIDLPPKGVGYSPAKAGAIGTLSAIPWQIKALFGIASDAFAIRGYHRTPYIVVAAFLGILAFVILGSVPTPPEFVVIMLLFFTNLTVVVPDVMIDASVAERCQAYPDFAVDLQSLGMASIAFGYMIGNLTAGSMYAFFEDNARPIFLITTIVPVLVFFPAAFGWITEEKDENPGVARKRLFRTFTWFCRKRSIENTQDMVSQNPSVDLDKLEESAPEEDEKLQENTAMIYMLALFACAVSIAIGVIVNSFDGVLVKGICYGAAVVLICGGSFYFLRGIHMDLVKVAIYIFLEGAIQPASGILRFWYRDVGKDSVYAAKCYGDEAESYNRPCLDAPYISSINVLGNFIMLLAAVLYNTYLSKFSYRKIWLITQSLLLLITFMDYAWVQRWNVDIGLSDKAMLALGDEVLYELIYRFESLPFLILAAKLCPEGLEATLFATILGISNLGGDMGSYLGSIILENMVIIEDNDYEGLDKFLLLRNLTRVGVILLIPILVPKGSPRDPSIYKHSNLDEESLEHETKEKRSSVEALVVLETVRRGSNMKMD